MSEIIPKITVTKLDAAHRQLRTAIELWFADGDPVSIHTLAAAAYQIIHDLNRRNKGPDLLLDTKFIKDEHRKRFVNTIKTAANFLKHADNRRSGTAKTTLLDSSLNQHFIMYSIFGLRYLREELIAEEIAFERWHMLRNPEMLSDAGKALLKKSYTIEQWGVLLAIPKNRFLKEFSG